jgi:hypothetical protein
MGFEETDSDQETGLKLLFRALKYRNYRLFLGGQTIGVEVGSIKHQE